MSDRTKWTLEDYQREIALCRKSAANHRKRADSYDAAAEELRKEASRFSTEKLPLFKDYPRSDGEQIYRGESDV